MLIYYKWNKCIGPRTEGQKVPNVSRPRRTVLTLEKKMGQTDGQTPDRCFTLTVIGVANVTSALCLPYIRPYSCHHSTRHHCQQTSISRQIAVLSVAAVMSSICFTTTSRSVTYNTRSSAMAEGPRNALVSIEKSLQSMNDLDIHIQGHHNCCY